MQDPKVAIIMPVYNSGIHLKPAIDAILKNTLYPYWRLIIVESESTDGTAQLCDSYQQQYPDKIEVYHTKKEGITRAINFGINQAGDDDIYLTQDDVLIPKLYGRDWLSTLVFTSLQREDIGAVTTLLAGGISGPEYLNGFQWVGTWSLYIPRKTINKVGLFDENFSPGPGDDIDYTYRIFKNKLKIATVNFWVDHHRMNEHQNDNIEEIKQRNASYFRKKHNLEDWGTWRVAKYYEPEKALEYKEVIDITNIFRNKLILDYGSGGGRDAAAIQLYYGGKVECCDITKGNLDLVKIRIPDITTYELKVSTQIPVENERFDVINCNGVLHHIADAKNVVKEFNRVLKKNGKVYCMLYTEDLLNLNLDEITKTIKENLELSWQQAFGGITDKCLFSEFYSINKAKKLFESNGFKLIQSKEFHDNQFRIFEFEKVN